MKHSIIKSPRKKKKKICNTLKPFFVKKIILAIKLTGQKTEKNKNYETLALARPPTLDFGYRGKNLAAHRKTGGQS